MKNATTALCLLIGIYGSSISCHASDFIPMGPTETAAVERAMFNFHASGIWPRDKVFLNSTKADLDDTELRNIESWFARVLKKEIRPDDNQWNSESWRLVSKLRWNRDFLLGHFASRNKQISRIEFQSPNVRRNLAVTIRSEQLFPNKQFSNREVRAIFSKFVNFPEDYLPKMNMNVMSASVMIGDNAVTYGKIYDARDKDSLTTERTSIKPYIPNSKRASLRPGSPGVITQSKYRPLIPNKKREWYSPMSFCIFNGRLSFHFSTFDWKSGDLPMTN